MPKLPLVAAVVLLAGCEPLNRSPAPLEQQPGGTASGRFELLVCDSFRDSYSHNGARVVYILRDRKTHAEYVGISGIGISELRTNGKTTTEE